MKDKRKNVEYLYAFLLFGLRGIENRQKTLLLKVDYYYGRFKAASVLFSASLQTQIYLSGTVAGNNVYILCSIEQW